MEDKIKLVLRTDSLTSLCSQTAKIKILVKTDFSQRFLRTLPYLSIQTLSSLCGTAGCASATLKDTAEQGTGGQYRGAVKVLTWLKLLFHHVPLQRNVSLWMLLTQQYRKRIWDSIEQEFSESLRQMIPTLFLIHYPQCNNQRNLSKLSGPSFTFIEK